MNEIINQTVKTCLCKTYDPTPSAGGVIPHQLIEADFRFLKVKGKRPVEHGWVTDSNYLGNDPRILKWISDGNNYGSLCDGVHIIIDLDNKELSSLLDSLPQTFTVRSGSGRGVHAYFVVDEEESQNVELRDPLTGDNVGNIQVKNKQCVAPGSIHESGGEYLVVKDLPVAHVDFCSIEEVFVDYIRKNPVIPATITRKTPSLGDLEFRQAIDKITLKDVGCYPDSARAIGNGEIQGAHPIHGSTTGRNLTINESKNVWYCHRCNAGGDPLQWLAVAEGIIDCGGELSGRKFIEVIEAARRQGIFIPELKKDEIYPKKEDVLGEDGKKGGKSLDNPKFESLLPEDNWINRFYRHHSETNKAPYPEYFHAAALTLIVLATGRRVFLTIAGRRHYSNIWTMCLGSTTMSNKTDAIDPVKTWARNLCPTQELPTDFSGAGLMEALADIPNGYMIVDEAGVLLNRIQYSKEAGTIRDIMCKLYDNDQTITKRLSSRTQKGTGEIKISNGFPALMLATTPETLSEYTTSIDIRSGWLVRLLYYYPTYAKEPTRMLFGYRRENDERELMEKYQHIMAEISEYDEIEAILEPDAEEHFQEWHLRRTKELSEDRVIGATFRRLEVMAIKLAINYTLADDNLASLIVDDRICIKKLYMEIATRQVDEYFLPHAVSVFEKVEQDANKNIQDKIIQKLKEKGGKLERWNLGKALHIKSHELKDHLDSLRESREVVIYEDNKTIWVELT